MTPTNPLLMNFRIPRDLKLQFQSACRERDTHMTAELLRFIRLFLCADAKKALPSPPRDTRRIDPHTGFAIEP